MGLQQPIYQVTKEDNMTKKDNMTKEDNTTKEDNMNVSAKIAGFVA
jgi:hypothetical protein